MEKKGCENAHAVVKTQKNGERTTGAKHEVLVVRVSLVTARIYGRRRPARENRLVLGKKMNKNY